MKRLPPDLEEALEIVAMEAQLGDPAGPALAWRVQRDVLALLRRRGIDAQVQVQVEGGGLHVILLLPQPNRRVEQVVFSVGRI